MREETQSYAEEYKIRRARYIFRRYDSHILEFSVDIR